MKAKLAVVDTNVWVSAFLTPSGTAAKLLTAMEAGQLVPVFSMPIEVEYHLVLTRTKFNIDPETLAEFFKDIRLLGLFHNNPPLPNIILPDPTDAPFIALALYAQCPVITGNTKHFPQQTQVEALTPAQWLVQQSTI